MTQQLEVVRDQLAKARRFPDVFGQLPVGTVTDGKRHLKKQYALLAKMTHPDLVEAASRALANHVFAELAAFHRRALEALERGVYNETFTPAKGAGARDMDKVTVSAGATQYHLDTEPFRHGDFSSIHLGKSVNGQAIFAKVATDPTMNPYLLNEASLLAHANTESSMKSVMPYMPNFIDSVILTEANNTKHRVNLFAYKPGYVSLSEIRAAYPSGLPAEDAAWIWRRVLGQTLAAHMLKTVHGAIVPDHILVHPVTHEPLHIGWTHAVEHSAKRHTRITTVIDRWRAWYPPEVFAREVPSHQTDLYMAGKTMVYLLGGDVARNRFPSHAPSAFVEVIARCLEVDPSRRPRDGVALMRDSTDVIRKLWGRTYRPLHMPGT